MENQMNNPGQNPMGGITNQNDAGSLVDKATSLLGNVNLNNIPESWKQYGNTAASKVKNMSTTQKVLGGALIAAGAWYLSSRSKSNFSSGSTAHAARRSNSYDPS
ncbi:MAG: hypothetical protein JWQ14_2941 [Adhaeribacter sp.]|jgi:hypothetical protein|nr:hypothetical protein [Adhaeribacter sp.]